MNGITWQRSEKARRLYTLEDANLFSQAASVASKNGAKFDDYVRLLRRQTVQLLIN